MRRLLALCLLLLPGSVWGQSVKLPAEIKGAVGAWIIVAPEAVDGGTPKWRIDPGLQEVRLDLLLPPAVLDQLKGRVLTALVPGRYKIEAWNAKGDVASDIATCIVVIGNPPPGPNPPPEPPGPEPPVPPSPAGPKNILLFYESGEMTPALSSLRVSLTNPSSPVHKHLLERQHIVYSLDDDSVSASAAKALEDWEPVYRGMTFPCLIIQDQQSGKVLHKQSIDPNKTTGQDVLSILKPYEG